MFLKLWLLRAAEKSNCERFTVICHVLCWFVASALFVPEHTCTYANIALLLLESNLQSSLF